MTGRPLVFVDTETTALGHFARPWEIALIRRSPSSDQEEFLWHVQDPLGPGTTPEALTVGGYFLRCGSAPSVIDGGQLGPEWQVARAVHDALCDVVLIGVGVHFDAAVLSAMFRRHGLAEEPWHYALVDLKAASWGYLSALFAARKSTEVPPPPDLPLRSEDLAAALGVEPPADVERHTALGDARWAARWFDVLTGVTP